VVRDVRVDRADEADVACALADMRKQFAHVHTALAVLFELERRAHRCTRLALGGHRSARQGLAMILVEHGLRIEAIHLRQSAVHVEEDDVRGAGVRNTDRHHFGIVIDPPESAAAKLSTLFQKLTNVFWQPGRPPQRTALPHTNVN